MFCGTWNVNGKAPADDISSWLCSLRQDDGSLPDLLAIGFQEIVDLNAANVVVGAASDKRSAKWEAHIAATLAEHGGEEFKLVRLCVCVCLAHW